ncbi:phosphotransferase family protein [Amycolatopsis alkalitolerans]|uniref:Phosphotransferase family protein n=1 Tax=Amycolatopsis alkalitolerans TaxID=2547244 RepID=A0A5C4MBA6_9PSEU|nr:phosphotransferase family protein [Amycolatopsis alkalitolerans]TNC29190.1 phosphotransferase family protein [Amycolatopsis alkalitolerans]
MSTATLPVDRLASWLEPRVPDLELPLTSTLIAGGRSNLTYRVSDAAGHRFALRRPPGLIEVEGAHDVAREFRIQQALSRRSGVRVAAQIAFCEDENVIGAPFSVMEFVDGSIVRDAASAATLDERARRGAGHALVGELVELHRPSPAELGLADLGRPEGYLSRQLRRWSAQIHGESATTTLLTEGHLRLTHRLPRQQRTALLHGDFRLDNVILSRAGDVRAVLDWELSTQGDPLADLGWLLLYWQPEDRPAKVLPRGSELPGFPTAAELTARYATGTGLDLTELPYYIAFAAWRLAVITLGVAARYRGGGRAGSDLAVDELTADAGVLAEHALTLLDA